MSGRGTPSFDDALAVGRVMGLHLPESRIARDAYVHAQDASAPWLLHHVVRSWLYGAVLARRRSVTLDPELFATAVLLHDLGLASGGAPDRRFEVVGADRARTFAFAHGMEERRAETVWDAVALHTTGSLAQHKGADVACCHYGIACDYGGLGLAEVSGEEQVAILSAFPRLQMKAELTTCLTGIVGRHPQTALDNFLTDFGHAYVPAFSRPSAVDLLHHSPFAE